MKNEDILIVSGDFNLSRLDWYTDDAEDADIAIPISASSEKEMVVLDTCHDLGLMQINKNGNLNGAMLDLVWTNSTDFVNCSKNDYHLLNQESHHKSYEINIGNFDCNQFKPTSNYSYRDFVNADYDTINESLNDVDWMEMFSGDDLDSHITKFYELIDSVISSNVVMKTKKLSSHPKWFNNDLINLKNRVNNQYKYIASRHTIEEKNYAKKEHSKLRREYKKSARLAYRNYKLEMENLINEDPQKFFEFDNGSKKTNDDLPNEMVLGDKKSSNRGEIAKSFATHFSKAYTEPDYTKNENYSEDEPLLKDLCAKFPTINITEEMVMDTINNLPNNMVSGPDGIPNIFVKECTTALLKPITHMLKKSLDTGFVPEIWKRMKNQIQTDAIYLDIAKAFDSVNIDLLIRKLDIMGLNQQLLKWIKSYLHGRQQIVKLNETRSHITYRSGLFLSDAKGRDSKRGNRLNIDFEEDEE
ncbi:uncharacterized protein LOC129571458 [Sitodiplosis mosellana]|uniref:uncharacterized protein LOC129571458 n=1 Tax=Sitodiplosis mosellana TaxID=263140 RepID=UPI002444F538|nr:uncharacterized protein LOC129571458 [Sitodiplosis mosellana]